ncbi:MAG: hypothetical protein NVSMB6_03950 [Burkholderiaceae bacterium]
MSSDDLLLAGAISGVVLLVLTLVKAFAVRQLGRLSKNNHFQLIRYSEELVSTTCLRFMVGVALLVGLNRLDFTARLDKWLQCAWVRVLVTQLAVWGNRVIVVAGHRRFEQQRGTNRAAATHLALVGMVTCIFLCTVTCLILLDNFGINIRVLVTSLGIGGIAVALAAQNILGDFIIVEDYKSTVEHVSMKTTRLRSLDGEQITISNT